jgi:hypothetical protein
VVVGERKVRSRLGGRLYNKYFMIISAPATKFSSPTPLITNDDLF